MEISNLPDKELKKNDYTDVHNTWEKKGGTQWELKILDNIRKNESQMKNSITRWHQQKTGWYGRETICKLLVEITQSEQRKRRKKFLEWKRF